MPPIKSPSKPQVEEESKPALKEKSKKRQEAEANRAIVYPDIDVQIFVGEKALTVEDAKTLLGWEEETETVKFGSDYTLVDMNGKKIRCTNNARNRPLNESWAKTIAQDILNLHWILNLETIIIGKYGSVLSGQHRLIGLILADQRRVNEEVMKDGTRESDHWKEKWPDACTIETIVAFGADESDVTTRTLDNTRPRTLADILYTSEIFAKYKTKDREGLCRTLDYAVRLLWQRTGAYDDGYSPRRTHSEALDFIERHQRITEAVKHVYEENSGSNAVSKAFSPGVGTAAGLLYLMSCSLDDGDVYRQDDHPNEKRLKFRDWDKACEFWVELSQKTKSMAPLTDVISSLPTMGNWIDEGNIRRAKIAAVCLAWSLYRKGDPLSADEIMPKIATNSDDLLVVAAPVFVGTVDVGDGVAPYNPADDDESADPDEEEIAERAANIRKEKEAKAAAKKNGKAPPLPKPIKKESVKQGTQPAVSMVTKEYNELKAKYPDAVILFQTDSEVFAYNEDARAVAKHLRTVVRSVNDVSSTFFFRKDFDQHTEKLTNASVPFVVVERRGDRWYDVADAGPLASTPAKKPPKKKTAAKT